VFTRDALVLRRNRIGDRPLMFEIDRIEAWDIDEELDFQVGEFLYHKRTEQTGS
jgi:CMP-N-acetylneuraminic acid synthetase